MEENKTEGQLLKEKLSYKLSNVWEKSSEDEKKTAFEFCEGYKTFLDIAKTEREFSYEAELIAQKNGFVALDKIIKAGKKLLPGMKVYQVNRKKSVILTIIALHGVIIKTNGEIANVKIGEDESDTVFVITDLLPHLAQDQMQKKMSEAITGEGLNLLFGSIPYNDEKVKDKVKLNILNLLYEKYGITEEDFLSAELEIVPAFKAKDVGLDRSMVGAYGQDDRVCAYTALKAILDIKDLQKTAVCVLTDKEEIGSVGNTGAQSKFMEDFIANICLLSTDSYSDILLRNCLVNSKMLSADVNAGVDPNYEGVQDKRNAAYLGKGVVFSKYTGSRGKAGASDANAEFIGELRRLFNERGIIWQPAELGKVDQGGGGTIAQYIANLGVDVIDCGVAVLSMHSPFEITSKIDVYTIYKAYKAFMEV